ncbi:MAG: MltA domain-containing protein [Phycisphaeraceae bacterium]
MSGCAGEKPDYSRPLPPGGKALRKITNPAELPDLKRAFTRRDMGLIQAIDRSLAWFAIPSTRQFYPLQDFTHEQARQSLLAFKEALQSSTAPADFEQRILRDFDVWTSVGWDGSGTVLYTGYYTPIFTASRVRTEEYRFPLYGKPPDLVVDPASGDVRGRMVNGQLKPYPTRAQIEYYPDRLGLTGREVAWMNSKLDVFIVQVQGSAKLQMLGGGDLYIGYAASNGGQYTSIGRALVEDGKIDPNRAGLPAIRAHFQAHPKDLDVYLNRNERYIFFKEYSPQNWPAGSLGFKVEPLRSLATDKAIYPRGCVTLVTTQMPAGDGTFAGFEQYMMDQDTGGAIRAPGRGDIYVGIGDAAEQIAGRQAQEGRLYYFFLKESAAPMFK